MTPTILHFRAHWSRARLESELDHWMGVAEKWGKAASDLYAELEQARRQLATYRELLGSEIDGFEVEVHPPKANVVPFRKKEGA